MLEALKPSQSFVIISDHEPRPLKYQIQARFPGLFDWAYAEQGPEVWRAVSHGDFFMKSGKNCYEPTGQKRLVVPTEEVVACAKQHPSGETGYTIHREG